MLWLLTDGRLNLATDLRSILTWSARSRGVLETLEAFPGERAAPLADGHRRYPEVLGNLYVLQSISGGYHNPLSKRQGLRRSRGTQQRVEASPLVLVEVYGRRNPRHLFMIAGPHRTVKNFTDDVLD